MIEKARRHFAQKEKEEQERKRRFGNVLPVMSVKAFGKQLVAVGNTIYGSEKWKYFSDFLRDYVPGIFGSEWVQREWSKPEAEPHLVIQWGIESDRYMRAQPLQPDGSRRGIPSGALAAFLAFAYDLYIVAHNGRLDDLLLHRLKSREQFQGARHELFTEATCLRGGFTVEREDEKDGSRRHAEFTARYKASGQQISVEAKSRHRAGVLGMPGTPQPHDKLSLRFGELINDAVRKNPAHPLVIFLDTNLPFRAADRLYPKQTGELPSGLMSNLLDRVKREHGNHDPYAMIVFTNHPHHYAAKDERDPQKHILSVLPEVPYREVNRDALLALHQAASIYGNIPNEFPAIDSQLQPVKETRKQGVK